MSSGKREPAGYELIDSAESLAAFCSSIEGTSWIALDTEFMREKTYYPELCLIQIGVPGRAACIDPLAIEDMSPVFDLLYDPGVVKVLHACSQDLEIFVHLRGEVPRPIFDTQLAAPLLGLAEQIGYGNFVREMLGVTLDKAHSRADWSHRPLSREQLEYAADDVRYLVEIYPRMLEKLDAEGRRGWLAREFEPYEDSARYITRPEEAWMRIRGMDKLRPRALAIAQSLAAWREQTARDRNLPRNWVIKDDVLMDIARTAPGRREQLEKIRNFQPRSVQRYGDQILERVADGRQREPQPLPERRRKKKATAAEEALADVMQAQLRLLADSCRLNAAIIASRKDLLDLVQGADKLPLLQGWRRQVAGEELLALRDGRRSISIENGQVVVSAMPDAQVK